MCTQDKTIDGHRQRMKDHGALSFVVSQSLPARQSPWPCTGKLDMPMHSPGNCVCV